MAVSNMKYRCDYCDSDLTFDEGCTRWRFELKAEKCKSPGGIRCDVNIESPLETTKHFCGFNCLRKWING